MAERPRGIPKSKRAEAERAGEWLAREEFACEFAERAVRTKFQRVDFFNSDVMGMDGSGHLYFIQVTTGQEEAVRVRRRKLEVYPWHPSHYVMVAQLILNPECEGTRRKDYQFIIHEYDHVDTGEWHVKLPIDIPREWYKCWKAEPTGEEVT